MMLSKNEVPLTFCCTLQSTENWESGRRRRRPCSKDVISLKPLVIEGQLLYVVILVGLI